MLRFHVLSRNTGVFRAFLAALLVASAACAADNAYSEYQRKLDDEMRKINNRYADIRKELDEEYVAISQEKDKNCNDIFEKVQKLKEERQKEQAYFSSTAGNLRETLARENIGQDDQKYISAVDLMNDRRNRVDRAYESSLATLQQLYQLNDKRFNELLKIHSARETLEENRLREERDIAIRRLANEARLDRTGLTHADKKAIDLRSKNLDAMAKESEERYQNSLNALDEYKSLVEKRLKAQNDYLSKHDDILRDIARDATDPMDRVTYIERLNELNADRNADERRYANDVRFIEEKLAHQQRRNRELSRLDSARREIEETWLLSRQRLDEQKDNLSAQLRASASDADKKILEERLADAERKLDNEKSNYEAALKNLDERRDIAEKSLDQRYSYIKDRNAIRVRMAKNPMNQENYDKYREEIAKLEESRMESEREIRNRIRALGEAMPAGYRQSFWHKGDIEARKARWSGRFDAMRRNLDAGWKELEEKYHEELNDLERRFNDSGITEADRAKIREVQKTLQDNQQRAQENYAKAIRDLDTRRQAAEQNLAARADYMSERNRIRSGLDSEKTSYQDVATYNSQLRDLDNRWAAQDRQFRDRERQFQATTPVTTGVTDVDTPGVVKSAYESVKDAVVDAYHDAVHYLTD